MKNHKNENHYIVKYFYCKYYHGFEVEAGSIAFSNYLKMSSDWLIYVLRYFSLLLTLSALLFVLCCYLHPFCSVLMILFKIEELMIFFTFQLICQIKNEKRLNWCKERLICNKVRTDTKIIYQDLQTVFKNHILIIIAQLISQFYQKRFTPEKALQTRVICHPKFNGKKTLIAAFVLSLKTT